jgi:hypothetical protein
MGWDGLYRSSSSIGTPAAPVNPVNESWGFQKMLGSGCTTGGLSGNVQLHGPSYVKHVPVSHYVVVKALCYKPEVRGFETR